MWVELKKIWGTVRFPLLSCISCRLSGYLSRLMSVKGIFSSFNTFFALLQKAHPVMENTTTLPANDIVSRDFSHVLAKNCSPVAGKRQSHVMTLSGVYKSQTQPLSHTPTPTVEHFRLITNVVCDVFNTTAYRRRSVGKARIVGLRQTILNYGHSGEYFPRATLCWFQARNRLLVNADALGFFAPERRNHGHLVSTRRCSILSRCLTRHRSWYCTVGCHFTCTVNVVPTRAFDYLAPSS